MKRLSGQVFSTGFWSLLSVAPIVCWLSWIIDRWSYCTTICATSFSVSVNCVTFWFSHRVLILISLKNYSRPFKTVVFIHIVQIDMEKTCKTRFKRTSQAPSLVSFHLLIENIALRFLYSLVFNRLDELDGIQKKCNNKNLKLSTASFCIVAYG